MRILALLIVLAPVAGAIAVYARARAQRRLRRARRVDELESENRRLDQALDQIGRPEYQVRRDGGAP